MNASQESTADLTGGLNEVDVVKAEITRNAMKSAALEMNNTLVRSAYNPLIFDVKDFGVGVMSAKGDLWADAPGLPVFTGVLPASVKSGLAKWGEDQIHDGDVFVVNSPYLNGTHISDTAVYMPVFYEGKLVAFTGSMAHWADVGGMSPGGWTVNSTEIYQEGISFTHQRLNIAGKPNKDILDLIENNMRVPSIVLGDMHAQIATARTGAERVKALCDRYSAEEVTRLMDHVLASTERSLRAKIAAMPDGQRQTSFRFDFNGVDRQHVDHVVMTTTVQGDRITVDFTGTSDQSPGPINAGAEASAGSVAEALKGILDPHGTANQAHLTVADIVWPDSPSLVNPQKPAPCDSYGYLMTGIVESMQLSLADLAPDKVRAGGYQMVANYIMSTTSETENSYVFAEPIQGGHGAYPGRDGGCMMFVTDGDASNTPIEVIEQRYPVECEEFSLNHDVSGAGEFRGGAGVTRSMRVKQTNTMIKTAQENTLDTLAKGVDGGHDGGPTSVELQFSDGSVSHEKERISDMPVPVGTLLITRTGGGGGYGDPKKRDPQRVAEDLRDGRITLREATDVYGVALTQGSLPDIWEVDLSRTAELRAE
ncbi:hydantoinase B/oxoprolinase family protein [Nesterenkonia alba]|uniref:hydantoinase B/oxoprolinase family protein n=1 Tax=Nesterenkonia alba TaxID=515814 RepID=UPI0003B4E36F|nr:hydantoinase B/oxoprolinase family protein [Nesterenkonia alba]